MTKKVHIVSKQVEVGEKTLGLCGKEFKVTYQWEDVPTDKAICRECVDTALQAMTEADAVVEKARRIMASLTTRLVMLDEVLRPDEDLILDQITERRYEFERQRREKAEAKEAKQLAKATCTCTWTSREIFEEDPNCPIHGGEDEPEEITKVTAEEAPDKQEGE